jgi:hypothetical protein
MRVKIASRGPIRLRRRHEAAAVASSAISATWRMKVDLPPMFGPVISSMRRVGRQRAVVGDEVLDLAFDHRMAAADECLIPGWATNTGGR